MNAITPTPGPRPQPRLPRQPMRRSDQEFLAPALEILERPASPIRLSLLIAICVLLTVTIAWAYFGKVDIIASAEGKIEPSGKVKVVQPLEAGRVAQILVQNGDRVSVGQPLIVLDDRDARAQFDDAQTQLWSAEAEIARRQAALTAVSQLPDGATTVGPIDIHWPNEIPSAIQAEETGVLGKDVDDLSASLKSIASQIDQKTSDAQTFEQCHRRTAEP